MLRFNWNIIFVFVFIFYFQIQESEKLNATLSQSGSEKENELTAKIVELTQIHEADIDKMRKSFDIQIHNVLEQKDEEISKAKSFISAQSEQLQSLQAQRLFLPMVFSFINVYF